MSRRYDASEIEPKWQQVWADEGLYRASEDPDDPRPRFYALDMFPYPSGDLHMGHAEAFSGGDAVARYQSMRGYNVLHPIGWDAFGLPAENAAIKRGVPPKEWTYANIEQQAASFQRMGMSFDWSRRLNTCDPSYYRWTQWLFTRFFAQGPGLPEELAGQLVPARPDGARERAGDPGRVRALRHDGGAPRPDAVVLQDHRLRPAAAGRHGRPDRLARARHHDAAQLDRAQRRRARDVHDRRDRRGDRGLHHAPRHPVGRHVLRVRGRPSGGGAPGRAGRHHRSGGAVARTGPDHLDGGSRGRRHQGRRVPGGPRREPGERRADPGLRRALRADGVRHRRDHGRAGPRPTRLRVRAPARPARQGRDPTRGRRADRPRRDDRGPAARRAHGQQRSVRRGTLAGFDRQGDRVAGGRRQGTRRGELPAARLVAEPPAVLGRAHPDRPLPHVRRGGGARRPTARAAAG